MIPPNGKMYWDFCRYICRRRSCRKCCSKLRRPLGSQQVAQRAGVLVEMAKLAVAELAVVELAVAELAVVELAVAEFVVAEFAAAVLVLTELAAAILVLTELAAAELVLAKLKVAMTEAVAPGRADQAAAGPGAKGTERARAAGAKSPWMYHLPHPVLPRIILPGRLQPRRARRRVPEPWRSRTGVLLRPGCPSLPAHLVFASSQTAARYRPPLGAVLCQALLCDVEQRWQ